MTGKVLLVADDADTRLAIEAPLAAAGYDTILAGDSTAAIQAARRENPDMVLLDLEVQRGSGFGVLQQLRRLGPPASLPVIVFSAGDPDLVKHRALAAGAIAFFAKPVNVKALLAAVRDSVRCHGADEDRRPGGGSILLVEDDADTRAGLSVRLKTSGYEVAAAADAVIAMSIADRSRPDLVILDLGLPGGNGFLMMERLKQHPQLARTPIIVLSAWDAATYGRLALAAGAAAFLQKPADNAALLAAIQRAIGKARHGA